MYKLIFKKIPKEFNEQIQKNVPYTLKKANELYSSAKIESSERVNGKGIQVEIQNTETDDKVLVSFIIHSFLDLANSIEQRLTDLSKNTKGKKLARITADKEMMTDAFTSELEAVVENSTPKKDELAEPLEEDVRTDSEKSPIVDDFTAELADGLDELFNDGMTEDELGDLAIDDPVDTDAFHLSDLEEVPDIKEVEQVSSQSIPETQTSSFSNLIDGSYEMVGDMIQEVEGYETDPAPLVKDIDAEVASLSTIKALTTIVDEVEKTMMDANPLDAIELELLRMDALEVLTSVKTSAREALTATFEEHESEFENRIKTETKQRDKQRQQLLDDEKETLSIQLKQDDQEECAIFEQDKKEAFKDLERTFNDRFDALTRRQNERKTLAFYHLETQHQQRFEKEKQMFEKSDLKRYESDLKQRLNHAKNHYDCTLFKSQKEVIHRLLRRCREVQSEKSSTKIPEVLVASDARLFEENNDDFSNGEGSQIVI